MDKKLNTVFEDAVASGVLTRANVEDYMYMYTDEVKGDAFKNKWTKEYVFNKPSKEVDIQSLVEAVKSHAYRHYNEEGGWDFVIETMEDEDIAGLLTATGEWEHEETPVTTLEEALKRVEEVVSLWDEQRYNYLV
jgi:translation elongation factor EF-1beta